MSKKTEKLSPFESDLLESIRQAERGEFAELVADLVTPGHFDPHELQRFLGLWWVGHIVGSADTMRLFLAPESP